MKQEDQARIAKAIRGVAHGLRGLSRKLVRLAEQVEQGREEKITEAITEIGAIYSTCRVDKIIMRLTEAAGREGDE